MLRLSFALVSLMLLTASCSSDDNNEDVYNAPWLHYFLPWKEPTPIYEEGFPTYNLAEGDTATVWMEAVYDRRSIKVDIADLKLSVSDEGVIEYAAVWKNPEGYVYHSIVTAKQEGTTFLFLQYKDLKDTIRINVNPQF